MLEHDPAHRLTSAVDSSMAAGVTNNTVPSAPNTKSWQFNYQQDLAQNLTARETTKDRAKVTEDQLTADMPVDSSGRNRPEQIGNENLGYDANGNRTTGANQHYVFDFRNRLSEVRDLAGNLVATYHYDIFDRRVRKGVVGGSTEDMAYSGWREVERYTDALLDQRYIRGAGIDEIVQMQVDVDGDGTLETEWTPLYDHTGNLVNLTDEAGDVVARYDYGPFGEIIEAHSDKNPPAVELVWADVENQRIRVEVDYEALLNNDAVTTEDLTGVPPGQSLSTKNGTALARSITRPVGEGPVAGRRFDVDLDTAPVAGTSIRLTIPADALADRFGNTLSQDFVVDFDWPTSGIQVVHDTAAPEVERVRVDNGVVEVTFSEPPAPGAVDALTITEVVPGQSLALKQTVSVGWRLDGDGYTYIAETVLPDGSFRLEINGTDGIDFAGNALSGGIFEVPIVVGGGPEVEIAFEQLDPTEVPVAAFVNRFIWHGRPLDVESGLLYFRNRYFDPQTGRFVSADPLGYVDGPSTYTGFGGSPLDYGDPLGLARVVVAPTGPEAQAIADGYLAAYERWKATSEGAKAHAEITDPHLNYTLYVRFDPDYGAGMVVGEYEFDPEGLSLLSATLTVGPSWRKGTASGFWDFPVGSRMNIYGAELKEIQRIGHEEAGHGMLPVRDPNYLALLLYKEYANRILEREQQAAAEKYSGVLVEQAVETACQMNLLFGPKAVTSIDEFYGRSLERKADFESLRFLPAKVLAKLLPEIRVEEKARRADEDRREKTRLRKYWKRWQKQDRQ